MAKKARDAYAQAGVDIDAGNIATKRISRLVRRTFTPRVMDTFGGFAAMFALDFPQKLLKRNYKIPIIVACTDGVGTKLKIAFMLDKHDTVGIDLVAMSINDLICLGAEPLFFLDYMATGKLRPDQVEDVVRGIANGCRESGCALIGGETAEMPDFYKRGEYDLAGFAIGVVEKRRIIDGRHIEKGDQVIGLHSSGLHSNGYSLVRKIFLKDRKMKLDKEHEELDCTLGEELLRPTRLYAKAIASLTSVYRYKHIVKGIVNITGGGLVENIPRILPDGCTVRINKGSWPVHPIYPMIKNLGKISEEEMYRVFNMGIGMAIIVPPFNAEKVLKRLKDAQFEASVIGEVRKGKPGVKLV